MSFEPTFALETVYNQKQQLTNSFTTLVTDLVNKKHIQKQKRDI